MNDELSRWVAKEIAILQHGQNSTPQVTPLIAEASFRQFYRVSRSEHSWIVMVSDPTQENNDAFTQLAQVFRRAQVPVPIILAANFSRGYFLLQDLGHQDLFSAYQQQPGYKDAALTQAIDVLLRLQATRDPIIPVYSAERFYAELGIFEQWYLTALIKQKTPDALLQNTWRQLVANTQQQPRCCVHRDYHCRNLLFDGRQLGVVDFQDALMGPLSYDLASLLRDCYHRFSEQEIAHWRRYYFERVPTALSGAMSAPDFARALDLTALQRQLKAIGIFARLKLRDNKATHVRYIPQVLDHAISIAHRYAELADFGVWLTSLPPMSQEA